VGESSRVVTSSKSNLYQKLPSVDELLRGEALSSAIAHNGRTMVTDAARVVLERLRLSIQSGRIDSDAIDQEVSGLAGAVEAELRTATEWSLRPVINATGVILHTNLGRAPLSMAALDHVCETARGYSNLEFDLAEGKRGERDVHIDRLFRKLFGEAAGARQVSTIVVNNNAAAVWLALNTLAAGGEVVVSRGEWVEIGGSFRIPDVMAQSNAILREVGTTNRTRIGDYARAMSDKTRCLLRVHRSNFEITGFTEQPALEEMAELARERRIPLVEDMGSGALLDLAAMGVSGEFGVEHSLRAGVDVVTYSGDKLLGGPQAGMLTGSADLVRRMRSNSLFRALRVDKLTYAALEATLLAYVKGEAEEIPAVRMMRMSREEIERRAKTLVAQLGGVQGLRVEVVEGESVIGGGAAPSAVLPTWLIAFAAEGLSADELQARLRGADPPVVARVQEDRVVLDLRTVFPEQDSTVTAALRALWAQH
jgi:L-seryl-tRNA(Ser) seleniumtransferase